MDIKTTCVRCGQIHTIGEKHVCRETRCDWGFLFLLLGVIVLMYLWLGGFDLIAWFGK